MESEVSRPLGNVARPEHEGAWESKLATGQGRKKIVGRENLRKQKKTKKPTTSVH